MRRRLLIVLPVLPVLLVGGWLLLAPSDDGEGVACPPGPGGCPVGTTLTELIRFWPDVPVPDVRLVSGRVETGCGATGADEGSFYCPQERRIYVQQEDLDGFDAALTGSVARASAVYLLAHEYGHAVQDARGIDTDDERPGPASQTVRYELQADCLAGVFAARQPPSERAAWVEAVRLGGDDMGEDPVGPAAFTHGSGEQRVRWFVRGRDAGEYAACDTFASTRL